MGIYPFGENIYQKLPIFAILGTVSPHFKSDNNEIWREVQTWKTLPALNFVKIAQGNLSLGGNFYQKFEHFAIFSYLSPYIYTDNVKILLQRTEDLGIHQPYKISSESLKGPAGIALSRR